MRKEKTVRGMVENLRNGNWVGRIPFGYSNLKRREKAKYHEYEIKDDGCILKEAFKWKASGNLNNIEIVAKMNAMGSKVKYKNINWIFRTPFYCGYIMHSLIPVKLLKEIILL